MRQIIIDTETTGLEPAQGHRIIEVGCIEMINRRMTGNTFHAYFNPEREVDEAATEVHGFTLEMLRDKPLFSALAGELFEFIKGAELIIHNAPFDVGFLNHEFALASLGEELIGAHCGVLDTLVMARQKHPGQKNNLDALCRRYAVDNTQRELHGALLDSEILADVYLAMTGGQISLLGSTEEMAIGRSGAQNENNNSNRREAIKTPLIVASEKELEAHQQWLELLEKESPGNVVWNKMLNSTMH
jgi:DNA polymerase-3 subunit epsilon